MTDRVMVVPYDPDWPRRFDDECSILAAVFVGSDAVIEHMAYRLGVESDDESTPHLSARWDFS